MLSPPFAAGDRKFHSAFTAELDWSSNAVRREREARTVCRRSVLSSLSALRSPATPRAPRRGDQTCWSRRERAGTSQLRRSRAALSVDHRHSMA
jgi:hypothetical protein